MSEISQSQKTALLKIPGFKQIQKQYAKEQSGSGKRGMRGMGRMRGMGFWDQVGSWFVQAGKDVNQFLKDSKIVSNVAAYALPILGAMGGALLTANPLGATAGGIVGKSTADYIKSQGYGATHRMPDGSVMKGKMHGMGIFPLAINMPNQRMRGIAPKSKMRGAGYGTTNNTVGVNGVPQKTSAPAHSGMIHNIGGKGMHTKAAKMKGMGGTEYGSVSSEFGNVKF